MVKKEKEKYEELNEKQIDVDVDFLATEDFLKEDRAKLKKLEQKKELAIKKSKEKLSLQAKLV